MMVVMNQNNGFLPLSTFAADIINGSREEDDGGAGDRNRWIFLSFSLSLSLFLSLRGNETTVTVCVDDGADDRAVARKPNQLLMRWQLLLLLTDTIDKSGGYDGAGAGDVIMNRNRRISLSLSLSAVTADTID